MNELYKKNEYETNEFIARAIRFCIVFDFLMALCCWVDIFDIADELAYNLILWTIIPLAIPTIFVNIMHVKKSWVKYVLILCITFVVAVSYVIFTFQVVILFLLPLIMAVMYFDKKLYIYSAVICCIGILISHIITGFYLFQPWIEPFTGLEEIIKYGAVPRMLQVLFGSFLLSMFWKRVEGYFRGYQTIIENNRSEIRSKESEQLEELIKCLTDREKEVFVLLLLGYTNGQIANELYLSVGTVKNYVSSIYDKSGIHDRTVLVLKYSQYSQAKSKEDTVQ